ncbi:MAG: HPr family phosphocarrier protein [Clostridia bacterium]|nr:HPr family phosphocarrier protein [Clostridia bacterium]MBQ5798684.1 HPr family phosphocarrier protein [Clostridia bacterium]MBQ5900349.1 HPr family phosphocarrier protein [Clostridia bacterium]MEE1277611.1 HPr family phosphocarrier protein [Acutalibacteraceae bacterium]
MVEETIMLYSIDDVKKLASIANTKKYDIDISLGKYLVNAKSIMGIFSLDLTQPLNIIAYSDGSDGFLDEIAEYIYKPEENK